MLLGIVFSLAVVSVYLDSKRNYEAEEEMARMQENGLFSLNLLKQELTLAGFFGGSLNAGDVTAKTLTTDCATGNWALNATTPIEFVNDHNSGSAPVTSAGTSLSCLSAGSNIEPETDVLVIKRTAGAPSWKAGLFADSFTASASEKWYLRVVNYGDDREWLKLAPAALKTAGGPYDPNGTSDDMAYWEAQTKIFYIRTYSETSGDGIPSLCVQRLEGDSMTPRCLVEGIEEMHIEFGIDTDNDGVANQYMAAPAAAEIDNAVVARVYLIVRSLRELPDIQNQDTKSYQLGQRTIAAKNDGYLRRVFSTTVQIRNAILPVS
jgi:hypothetical protein